MAKLTKIQRFARGKPCSLRIPDVHRTTPENEDVVLAHAPYPGRGGMRSHDWWGCPACSECHDYVDGRGRFNKWGAADVPGAVYWMPAIHEWQAMLFEAGFLRQSE
jgi:hypothetical protein